MPGLSEKEKLRNGEPPHLKFLRELLPGGSKDLIRDQSDLLVATLPSSCSPRGEEILLACWEEEREEVTIAGYGTKTGKCFYLWRGALSFEGSQEAYRELREEGLTLRVPERRVPERRVPERRVQDILDIFG